MTAEFDAYFIVYCKDNLDSKYAPSGSQWSKAAKDIEDC